MILMMMMTVGEIPHENGVRGLFLLATLPRFPL
jgi:hypothetical protein